MAHERTESSSTSASTSSSLHLPSIDSQDSTHAHEGLFREHMANNISVAHAARLNAQDARVRQRASPVTLRFLRSTPPNSAGSSSAHTHSAIVGASRIPLPRSTSAPDKLNSRSNHSHDDAVQMASYPTPPLPAHSKTGSAGILELDHPRLVLPERTARASSASNSPTRPAAASSLSTSPRQAGTVATRSPGLPHPVHAASPSYTLPQGQFPTPPKRHPLRPVLQSAQLFHARSNIDPQTVPSAAHSPSPRSAHSYSSPCTNTTAHSPSLQSAAAASDVLLLTPARTEDDPSSPGSAAFTSAFSSPLDSASIPRSFLQQQQQTSATKLQSVSESKDETQAFHSQHDRVTAPVESESKQSRHKHSFSDVSEQSIRSSRTGQREDTAEEEILASIGLNIDNNTTSTSELEISSPELLSGQGFISSSSLKGGADTKLSRSSSISSSISSMSSSLTGSEAHSLHVHTATQRVDTRQRRLGDTASEQESGNTSLGHNDSFLDLNNVSATPRQTRNVSSSSALNSQSPRTNTPRVTASSSNQSPTASSASNKASLSLRYAMETNESSTPSQLSKLSSSLERTRDGTFGMDADINSKSGSPASIEKARHPHRARVEREDSEQSASAALGHLPRSGTVGDISFSGSPSLAGVKAISKSSPRDSTRTGDSPFSGTTMLQHSTSSASLPLGQSSTTSGSGSVSAGSIAQSVSTRLLPPSDKIKDSLNRSSTRRPGVVHHSSSKTSTSASLPKEVKAPTVPGMEDPSTNIGETHEGRTTWKKKGQEYPKWDVTQPLWYKAPQWGRLPQKGMRAHSATIVSEIPFAGSSSSMSQTQTTDMANLFALDPTSGSKSNSLYIFGGCDSINCFKELYKLDLKSFQWTKPRTLSNQFQPPALRAHSTTYIPPFRSLFSGIYDNLDVKDQFPNDPDVINIRMKSRDGHLLFFGGGDGPNYFNDIYLLNLTTMTWSKPVPPSSSTPSNGSTANSQSGTGGKEGELTSNTQHVYGSLPSPRRAHTTVWYEKRKELVIFGGGNGSKALNETWVLECKDWKKLTWKKIDALGKKPRVRGYHTMNLLGDRAIVFGGSDGTECFSDVFVLDLDTFTWTEIPIYEPSLHCPRLSHSSTLISATQILVLGGHNGTDYKKDITIFSLATGKFYNITNTTALECYATMGPSRRGYHSTCLDDGRIIMVGGYDGKKHFDEVWCLEIAAIAAFGE